MTVSLGRKSGRLALDTGLNQFFLLGCRWPEEKQPRLQGKALTYFHDVPRISACSLEYRQTAFDGESGFLVSRKGKEYWVPDPASASAFPQRLFASSKFGSEEGIDI